MRTQAPYTLDHTNECSKKIPFEPGRKPVYCQNSSSGGPKLLKRCSSDVKGALDMSLFKEILRESSVSNFRIRFENEVLQKSFAFELKVSF